MNDYLDLFSVNPKSFEVIWLEPEAESSYCHHCCLAAISISKTYVIDGCPFAWGNVFVVMQTDLCQRKVRHAFRF